mgnify:CR=1 FL=1
MARGLMEGYANTTPTGFEGVGGNPAKSAVQTPDMNVVNQTANTGQATDTGQSVEETGAIDQAFNNLSEESKANFASVASSSTIAALKEFLVGSGRFTPEEAAALDKIPAKDMIHISLDALIANPQQIMAQLQNVIAEVQGQGQTTDMAQADRGMMANEAATDRPPTQPV